MDKEEFLEKARQANNKEIGETKLSDLTDKDSAFYKNVNTMPKEEVKSIPQKPKDPYEIPSVRTFKADVADAVNTENLSMSKIVQKEVAKKREKEINPEDKKIKIFYIISGIIGGLLIIGGIVIVLYSFVFLRQKETEATPQQIVIKKPFIRTDEEVKIDTYRKTSRDILSKINDEIKNPPKTDGVRKMIFVTEEARIATLDELLYKFESNLPDELERTLQKNVFAGINFSNGEGDPFIILFGESYDSLFAGSIKWEERLPEDMSVLFGKDPNATTTDKYVFKDAIIENRDSRVLLDKDGKIRFFYSILEDNIMFFGNSQRTLREILARIRETKLTK